MENGFYFGMKVSLKGEVGVVIRPEENSDWDREPGIIHWDTIQKDNYEDWRGLFGSFTESGGKEIDLDTPLKFIEENPKY